MIDPLLWRVNLGTCTYLYTIHNLYGMAVPEELPVTEGMFIMLILVRVGNSINAVLVVKYRRRFQRNLGSPACG
jgi:hypothetical protein